MNLGTRRKVHEDRNIFLFCLAFEHSPTNQDDPAIQLILKHWFTLGMAEKKHRKEIQRPPLPHTEQGDCGIGIH